jgi:hypothetical protein
VFCVGISAVATSVAAGAPLASDNDNPAAPNNGTAHARCFRFETCFARDMTDSFGQMIEHQYRGETLAGLDQFLMAADRHCSANLNLSILTPAICQQSGLLS